MAKGKIPTDHSFKWPVYPGFSPKDPKNVHFWNGCIAELKYVVELLEENAGFSASARVNAGRLPLTENSKGIHVEGHMGTWRVIGKRSFNGESSFVLEHEIYGDRANNLLVDKNAKIIQSIEPGELYDPYDF